MIPAHEDDVHGNGHATLDLGALASASSVKQAEQHAQQAEERASVRVEAIRSRKGEVEAELESLDTEIRVKSAAREMEKLQHAKWGLALGLDIAGSQKRTEARTEAARKEARLQELRGTRSQLETELIHEIVAHGEVPRSPGTHEPE